MFSLFELTLLVFGLVFAFAFIITWRNRDMGVTKKAGISLLLVLGLMALSYVSFALVLISSDHAYYSSNGEFIGNISYDGVISSAETAGYDVEGPYFINSDIGAARGLYSPAAGQLNERFGNAFWVVLVKSYYSEGSYLEASFTQDETVVSFFNESRDDPYFSSLALEDLPDDEWMLENLEIMFSLEAQESEMYLRRLKDVVNTSGSTHASIEVNEPFDLASTLEYFEQGSTNSTYIPTNGEGWSQETFYAGDRKVGSVSYVVEGSMIVNTIDGKEYIIHVDRMGGVKLQIRLHRGEHVSEDEYIDVFSEMFDSLGLPVDRLDEFEFEYTPSVW